MKQFNVFAIVIFTAILGTTLFFGYRFLTRKKLRSNTIERTLAIIKPDAVRAKNTGKIIDRIEQESYTIIDMKKVTLDREPAERLYQHLKKESYFSGLIDFITSGPVVVLILEKMNAIADWRDLIGCTDPKKARTETIRHQFGSDIRHNAVHGSDNHEAAIREIKLFFADRIKA